jgi:transglycosylase-like protein
LTTPVYSPKLIQLLGVDFSFIMIETILSTVLSSALILRNPSLSPKPQNPHISFTQVLPEKNYVSYIAGKNEDLGDVSLRYYGSADYWTNIWNDNPQIADPNHIEGINIAINVTKTDKPAALTSDLAKKQDELNQKKNQEYLASIGYPSTTVTVQTPTPTSSVLVFTPTVSVATPAPTTQIPVVTQTVAPSDASAISDQAINYLGSCEAGMNPSKDSGNGYYGAFQFSYGTWKSMNTGYERADLAPIEVQKAAVRQLVQRSSVYSQFPACASKMHAAGLI